MNGKPAIRKISAKWIILAALAGVLLLCVAAAFVIAPSISLIYNQFPQVKTQGKFENATYTAPKKNFTCRFPWQGVSGERLTDTQDKISGMVKYRNDFGVTIAVEYGVNEQYIDSWPVGLDKQTEVLEDLYSFSVKALESNFRDVEIVHSEQRDNPQPEFFAATKYYTDQDDSSLVKRGDLLFFRNTYFYSLTYAVFAWSPTVDWSLTGDNIQGKEWINTLDKVLDDFYSGCEFKE